MIDIDWFNNFGPNGYGICGRMYVGILSNLGYKVKITPYPYMDQRDPLMPLTKTVVKDPLRVMHSIPLSGTKEECYYTVTEVKRPPDIMNYALEQTKFIMTQSEFCKESFSRVTESKKIHVVNFPFPKGLFAPIGPTYKLQNIDKFKFKFFTVARVDIRKNLVTMMNAFKEEFGDNPEVCLVMKIGSDRYCIPKMFYDLDLPKNIIWMRDFVEDTSMLYRTMDAYVATDCGEGWGAPTTEAMLCGLPTIAPRHSGHLDYMNDDNSYLIDVGDWESIGYDNEHPERGPNLYPDLLGSHLEWKVPKFDDIKKNMGSLYDKYKDMTRAEVLEDNMIKNSLKVQDVVSEEYVGKQLKKALDWYEAEYK